jgi:hypothetical protein
MIPQIGYLLPTREAIMQGRPENAPLLHLAEPATSLGFGSIWGLDSHVRTRATHWVLCFAGDHTRHLEAVRKIRHA